METLVKQEEGVQLWRTSSTKTPYFIRSLRTRETWDCSTEAKASEVYDLEVVKSRDCAIVQKKLGSF